MREKSVMIDWPRVKQLHDEVGADEFGEVVETFLDEVQEVVARLRSDKDRAQIEENLHFLKGSALSLGFNTLSQLCMNGEEQASQGKILSVDIDAIVEAFEQTRVAFLSALPEHV